MLYNVSIKKSVLDTLENRVSSIVDSNIALAELGYIPNKIKRVKLEWSSILIHAYENIDVFNEKQQGKIDNIFNAVIKL